MPGDNVSVAAGGEAAAAAGLRRALPYSQLQQFAVGGRLPAGTCVVRWGKSRIKENVKLK